MLSASLCTALITQKVEAPTQRLVPITPGVARQRMYKLAMQAGVPYRGYHTLRHAAGTRAAQEGLGLESITQFLGHSNVQTTRVYQH